jgi:putative hydroxymethylpyrimidine transport system permease protein
MLRLSLRSVMTTDLRSMDLPAPSAQVRARADRVPWTALATLVFVLGVWEGAVRAFDVPSYLLPAPSRVAVTLVTRFGLIWPDALVTFGEMVGGLLIGVGAGIAAALLMARAPLVERALGPILVVTQALPVFAIAPLLVIWLGFGLASKLAMAALIIFFPVSTNFLDGLRRTDENLVDLARLHGASRRDLLLLIRVPSALPALCSGLRIAAANAPIGAIIGEWVGSSAGLGLMMLHANARMQTDTVFAGLAVLVAFSIALWAAVGALTRRLVAWAPETL